MTTKEQERKALEKIKAIVNELGADSYVGTALDGALLLAEQNIDDDAAYSARYYMEALSNTESKLKAAEEQIAELRTELANQQEISNSEYSALNRKLLSDYETSAITRLLTEKIVELQQEVNGAAARIVEAADNPKDAVFSNAVRDHRTAAKELENYTTVLRGIKMKGEIEV